MTPGIFFGLITASFGAVIIDCDEKIQIEVSAAKAEVVSSAEGYLVISEANRELEVSVSGAWRPITFPAPRFARIGLDVKPSQSIALRPAWNKSALANIELNCNPDRDETRWFTQAEDLSAQIEDAVPNTLQLFAIKALRAASQNLLQKAFAEHLYANMLFSSNDTLGAEAAFSAAAELWDKVPDQRRRALALIGVAHLADRRDDFSSAQKAAELAKKNFAALNERYFVERANELNCRRLMRTAMQEPFKACLSERILAYRALGEAADEIGVVIELASALRAQGQAINLDMLIPMVDTIPRTSRLAAIRGRFAILSAQIAQDQGDLSLALKQFSVAIREFESAIEESSSWRVYAMNQSSVLLARLGLVEQGQKSLTDALKLFDVRANPAAAATIFSSMGKIFSERGEFGQAMHWFGVASKIFELMQRPIDKDLNELFRDESALEEESRDASLMAEAQLGNLPASSATRLAIFRANLLLRQSKIAEAKSIVSKLRRIDNNEQNQNALSLLESRVLLAQAKPSEALVVLQQRLFQLAQSADRSPSASVAYLTLRSGEKLRRVWVDAQSIDANVEAVYQTVMLSNPARYLTPVNTPLKQLSPPTKQAPGESGFLTQLTRAGPLPERIKALEIPKLAALQARLPTDGRLLMLVPGERQSLALWIGRETVEMKLLAPRKRLQASAQRLAGFLTTPISTPLDSQRAARELSALLFAGQAPELPAPTTLWIMADELAESLPFSTLYWPGKDTPLLASTEVSFITGISLAAATQGNPPSQRIFFAPDYALQQSSGPVKLDFSAVERALIEAAVGGNYLNLTGAQANRINFQDLIQTPNIWLHISAHGNADPGVLGNAGLWLSGGVGGDADFLSWLELGNLRVQTDLLVLNACQSATGAQPSRQANISFALAMSASGAKHVVAALWPVSDSAANTWIPAFYRGLAVHQNTDDSASALRQAQLRLLHSPHYQHPFYWASLVHFQHVVF